MFIYVIVCNETLKIYIGQHKGNNLQKYLQTKFSDAKCQTHRRSHLFNAMRIHPKDSWSIHPIVSGIDTRTELDEVEKHFIRVLKTQHPDVGYNICDGGEGFTGPFTDEHRAKLRAAIVNRPPEVEAERRKRLSEMQKISMLGNTNGEGNKGNKCPKSEEFRRRVSAKLTGRKKSEEFCRRLSVLKKGNKNFLGKTHSEDARRRIGEAHKGSQSFLGHHHSEESKQAMRKPKSAEAVQHMTDAWKLRPRKNCPHGSTARKCRECGRERYARWYERHNR